MSCKVEIVKFEENRDNREEMFVQLAVDNVLAVPFTIHKADLEPYRNERDLLMMFYRQAVALIRRYGDARERRPVEMVA